MSTRMLPLAVLFFLAAAAPATAQDDAFTWDNATELSFVSTGGNASSTTLGLKSTLDGSGGPHTFKFEIGGIRASSDLTERTAIGTPASFALNEITTEIESAENYFARSRYDRNVGVGFAFGGAGWERNTFAGFNNRFSFVAGVGRTWVDGDVGLFKTDIGGTYTIQKDIEDDPTTNDGFGGLRATIDAKRTLTETTDFATTFILDENLTETDDLRFDWVSSIAVALTEGLAFKTSYQLLFDNRPALIGVPLFDTGGAPAGSVNIDSEKVDSFLTLSLVIKL